MFYDEIKEIIEHFTWRTVFDLLYADMSKFELLSEYDLDLLFELALWPRRRHTNLIII